MKKSKIIGVISAVCLVLIAIIAALLLVIFSPWNNKNTDVDLRDQFKI